jgi:uncharacterized protein (TIGR03437 family)
VSETSTIEPTLVVHGGPLDGTVFTFDASASKRLIGASDDCDFQILLGNVEPVHASLTRGPGGLMLSDGGSATGTFVNGEKIEADYALQDGDRICLGPPGAKESAKLLVSIPAGSIPAFDPNADLRLPAEPPLVLVAPTGEAGLELASPVVPSAAPSAPRPEPAELTLAPPPAPAPPPPMVEEEPTLALTPPPPEPPPEAPRVVEKLTAPAPSEAPAREARKPVKADYATDPPSIAPPASGEPARVPPLVPPPGAAKPRPAATRATPRPLPRRKLPLVPILGVLAVLALGGAGFYASRTILRKAPQVLSVVPLRTEPGQTITISGSDFDTTAANNTVRIADQVAAVESATDTQLAVTVPANIAPADVQIVVETRGKKSNALPLKIYVAPRASGIEPDVALPGAEVVIKGEHLDGKPLNVTVGGLPAEVKSAERDAVQIVVPEVPVAEGKSVPVSVQVGADTSKPVTLLIGRLPLVAELQPSRASMGDKVVVKGRGFDTAAGGNAVTFGGQHALVLSTTPTEIAVAVPATTAPEGQGSVDVVVTSRGAASSPAAFVLVRASSATFLPRFFAIPAPEHPDVALVSTELGPVLALGGRGEALAQRAFEVAAALNTAVTEAASKPATFEVRDKPDPGVAIAGNPTPIVRATADDAAAYGRSWDAGQKPGRAPGERALATYWAALLQDYFSLFVAGQRPLKVLELSPRGKVLNDLFAESQRQAPQGGGVPNRVVKPLNSTYAKGLREIALYLPAQGQSRAAAAIEGRWDGTMDEPGAGSRAIKVAFRNEGAALAGTLTSRAGKVEMNTPLRDVKYEKGGIRFAVDVAGSSRFFVGTVEGAAMKGTVAKSDGEKSPAGTFSLRYVE